MGYTGYEAHERADELGDTFSDEMVERIDEKLGHPERCPHGWPVDPDVEQEENAVLAPLAALAARHARDDRPARRARRRAPALVLRPGARARDRRSTSAARASAADQFTVGLDGGERAISEKAAAGLFVRAVPA